jgi:acyl-CoA thioesterase-1
MGYTHTLFKKALSFMVVLSFILAPMIASAKQKILVWGDSLSAAYGIPVEKGWVSLMQDKLGEQVEIVNGSISGETTQGGLTRLPKALIQHKPDFVILELGANDGLRGIPPSVTKSNLKKMIELTQQTQAKIMLLGMKIPPNYGMAYTEQFEEQFSQLAKDYKLSFIPFFLEDVAQDLALLQEDELHPTAEAQPIILEKVLTTFKSELL